MPEMLPTLEEMGKKEVKEKNKQNRRKKRDTQKEEEKI